MKILYLTSTADYVSDSLLHGLRTLHGADLVDFPKAELLYDTCPPGPKQRVRGNAFTLHTGLLKDIPVDRVHVVERVKGGEFDLIVLSDIWQVYPWLIHFRPWLRRENTIVIDGSDSPVVYPHAGMFWRTAHGWLVPSATPFLYFKREWTEASQFNLWHRVVHPRLLRAMPAHESLRKIAISMPAEKIVSSPPQKTKDFPRHVVDPEVAARVPGSQSTYAFLSEAEYYADLRSARFGITTKRAGWDCLRHYEIAANGAVPCFARLFEKPATCAPHGLNPANCIVYADADDLFRQIAQLSAADYNRLQVGALEWARANSTVARASEVLAMARRA
jgi:hypothetical protein